MDAARETTLTWDELDTLCRAAVRGSGGSERTAAALAASTVAAEQQGKVAVGAAHLLDYLDALAEGRLVPDAIPGVQSTRAGVVRVDAAGGTAQAAFDAAFPAFVRAAGEVGVAVLSLRDGYSAGELGYYARRVADRGLIALVCANSPALMSVYSAPVPVTGTNPMAFALPHASGPRSFDQASSATAWVSVRAAADRSEPLPEGWALDAAGAPTTDAGAALDGALLPFGGAKGSNIALMVEMLAVLSGGMFSQDAAPFDSGSTSPSLGLFVLALDPEAFDPGYSERVEQHLRALAERHGADFGRRHPFPENATLPASLHAALTAAARQDAAPQDGGAR
ncbi:Ldh family oxidoreductase [Microbacterium sp. NPDC008134]|uniref:Ldh family oxidoreductase n=1 Tax=Microbacterium sp. NPDC008134 TaxID=3364183 RepID=UPI0036E72536